MIRSIFLPEKLGSSYLFSQSIVGIEIRKTHVFATKLVLSGQSIVLKSIAHEPIEAGTADSFVQRTAVALQKVYADLGKADLIHSCIHSNHAIFRELEIPFTDREKIRMMLTFEIEQLLPFPAHEAIIDFIITGSTAEGSRILAAIVQKKHIIEHLQLFEAADIQPHHTTIDLFALSGLYTHIPMYQTLTSAALIEVGTQTTRVALMKDNALRMLRTIPHGLASIAKHASQKLDMSTSEVTEYLVRFGLTKSDTPSYAEAVREALEPLSKALSLTLTTTPLAPIEKGILFGAHSTIKGLDQFLTTSLSVPCELFDTEGLSQAGMVMKRGKHGDDLHETLVSLSAAFPSQATSEFTLLRDEFKPRETTRAIAQLLTGTLLCLLLLVSLLTHIFWQQRKLSSELTASTREAIEVLTERFPALNEDVPESLEEAADMAEDELKKEENAWFKFSQSARTSFLAYLLELTTIIDRKKLEFRLDTVTFDENSIVLKAHVRDHDALIEFERALRQSKLFTNVESPNDPDFTMKISISPGTRR